jgi:hypothetical protein
MAEVVGWKYIELSPAAFDEIQTKLIEAGYDWLAWVNKADNIVLDGFVAVREKINPDATPTDTGS